MVTPEEYKKDINLIFLSSSSPFTLHSVIGGIAYSGYGAKFNEALIEFNFHTFSFSRSFFSHSSC